MDLVVDANILFAALIKRSKTAELMFKANIDLFAPEYLFDEFANHEVYILNKTKRSASDFQRVLKMLRKRIRTISSSQYQKKMREAEKRAKDQKDVDYVALALALGAAIWSNDKAMKDIEGVVVITTEELDKLLSRK